uniref:pentatricopeptide repeat-containing protein At5g13270, chloroplastic n=1 Tax=Erigeron canadensis TaxID=72917 RepID=UPI001CB8B804|nr:pentatricopeptide repeat-containing protein At5g13270, chloroplastic [Erigeron canadensis]
MASIPPPPSDNITTQSSLFKTANFTKFSLTSNNPKTSLPLQQQQQKDGLIENLHLVSLSKQGKIQQAQNFIIQMNKSGVPITLDSYDCLLKTCTDLRFLSAGHFIFDHFRQSSLSSVSVQNRALQMYCECSSFLDAYNLFDEMTQRNLASWGILISGYSKAGLVEEAVKLFSSMDTVKPDISIYLDILRSLADSSSLHLGKQMHSLVIKNGYTNIAKIDTTILNMYAKCGCFEDARLIFDKMAEKNTVAWTCLMVGYVQIQKGKQVLDLFLEMIKEGVPLDEYVFSIVLKACALLENLAIGLQIHGYVLKLGMANEVSVGTPLVDFYVKSGALESATRAFKNISEPNDFSWSALLTGYSQAGEFDECLKIFKSLKSINAKLNSFIYTTIFQACSAVADISFGAQTHGDAIKRGLVSYLYGESAMITMYAKCGRLDYARQVFDSIQKPDSVTWTAIIAGYAYHGNASEALRLFKSMLSYNVMPTSITFIAVFTAYNYCGLVEEAKACLDSMSSFYAVEPSIHHYNCMIDIYARAGLLNEAFETIKNMPFEPNTMSWKCLLGGCSIHKNLDMGKIAAENVLLLDPHDTSAYVLMFNLYASCGQWEEASLVRKSMALLKLRKDVSCSWISVKGKVHRFVVGDRHHPQVHEIYSKLKEFDYLKNDTKEVTLSEDDVLLERKEQLLDHSERLAIAYGLISKGKGSPITIFKNLRACKDCHEFAKHVSMVTGREIVIRDANRFHHFKSGTCSCGDYW